MIKYEKKAKVLKDLGLSDVEIEKQLNLHFPTDQNKTINDGTGPIYDQRRADALIMFTETMHLDHSNPESVEEMVSTVLNTFDITLKELLTELFRSNLNNEFKNKLDHSTIKIENQDLMDVPIVFMTYSQYDFVNNLVPNLDSQIYTISPDEGDFADLTQEFLGLFYSIQEDQKLTEIIKVLHYDLGYSPEEIIEPIFEEKLINSLMIKSITFKTNNSGNFTFNLLDN